MPYLWRLEYKRCRRGVYQKHVPENVASECKGFYPRDHERCPAPRKDPLIGDWWRKLFDENAHHDWHFGFPTLAHYKKWFFKAKARRVLANSGIVLRRYEVPEEDMKRGVDQVAFRRDRQVMIEERSPAYGDL